MFSVHGAFFLLEENIFFLFFPLALRRSAEGEGIPRPKFPTLRRRRRSEWPRDKRERWMDGLNSDFFWMAGFQHTLLCRLIVYSRVTTSAMAERPPFFPALVLLDIAGIVEP